jgi:molybdopterin-guanine dinucleotide biosynthesis protein
MHHLPNWIIVYGTDRNSGKTTLITRIIQRFAQKSSISGLKISPHFHLLEENAQIIIKTDHYVITRENIRDSGKDSSRMLDAGAKQVFYVQVWDNNLESVLPGILEQVKTTDAVICESGWARNLVKPGLFLILNRKGNTHVKESLAKLKPLADAFIEFDGEGFEFDLDRISIENGNWKFG